MEFQGRIAKVLPMRQGTSTRTGNEWYAQPFVFEYFENPTDRWSDKVLLSIMGERIREADLHEGDEVIVGFGPNTREWNGKYFNDVRCYKLEKVAKPADNGASGAPATPQQGDLFAQAAQNAPQSTQAAQVAQQPTAANANAQTGEKEDELPF